MAADQERADRIRQVRQDKHLRWKQIATYVGVEMRSAQMWQETGAISWDNAVKLAELAGVDPHWLMSGAETNTPDLFPEASIEERVDRMERRLTGLIEDQNKLLARQSVILERIEGLLSGETGSLLPEVLELLRGQPQADQSAPPARRTRRASAKT